MMKPTIRFASTVSLLALLAAPAFAQGMTENMNAAPDAAAVSNGLSQDDIVQEGRTAEQGTTPRDGAIAVLGAIDSALVAGETVQVVGADGRTLGTLLAPALEQGNALSMRVQLDDALNAAASVAQIVSDATLDSDGRILVPLSTDEVVAAAAGAGEAVDGGTATQGMLSGGESRGINLDMPDAARGTM